MKFMLTQLQIAREDFVASVNNNIAEPYVWDLQGPMLGLGPKYIVILSPERVEELGGESQDSIAKRKRLRETIDRLINAKDIARRAYREGELM